MTENELDAIRKRCDAATVPIPEFFGYEISKEGDVYSLCNWRGYGKRRIKSFLNASGYPSVRLSVAGKRKHIAVHRLVAKTFLPIANSFQDQIRHKDGNPNNCHADNLEWGNAFSNAQDRERHGKTAKGENNGFSKLTKEDILKIRSLSEKGNSQRMIARLIGISQTQIGKIIKREAWNHI